MRTRPWPLVLLAIFQILSPVGTVLFNAWGLGVKPIYVMRWIWEKPFIEIFESLFLMPIAGVAIYQMKAWAYAVFIAAMGWSIFANIRNWHYAAQAFPVWKMLLVYGFQILLALYFMIPSVRQTYLDRSVRWWEAKRRFTLKTPVALSSKNAALGTAESRNISEGGLLIETDQNLDAEKEVDLRFEVLGMIYLIPGIVRYAIKTERGSKEYGIQFKHTVDTHAKMKRLVRGLKCIGVSERDEAFKKPAHQSMREWFFTVLKTGKGMTPEIKSTRKA